MTKQIVSFILVLLVILCSSVRANVMEVAMLEGVAGLLQDTAAKVAPDTIPPRYPVAPISTDNYENFNKQSSVDLNAPSNIKTEVEYDPKSGNYVIRTKLGEREINNPFSLTPTEYIKYIEKREMYDHFRARSSEKDTTGAKAFDFKNMSFSLGPAEKIFGPGGVQIKAQGSAEVSMGVKMNSTKNPSLPESARNKTIFDFDEKVQLNINAKVGDKVNFDMNYNTEASFDFDSKKLKLAYEGKEDEIIKVVEAGNVSMPTSSSLIRGTQALFGIKTGIQLGKFKATAVISQQESESKSVNMEGGAQLTPFEIKIDQYDENRHFFISQFFYENYDLWMAKFPYISSGININRLEVWVTNKRGNYNQSRDVVAFLDMAEGTENLYNKHWQNATSVKYPQNENNSVYVQMAGNYLSSRNMSGVTEALRPLEAFGVEGGQDFEKIENARRLEQTEYRFNAQLGYLSLNTMLQPDEVLAVAYEYTYRGTTYQVGEFSTDGSSDTPGTPDVPQVKNGNLLLLKLIKGTLATPKLPNWKLMMKNVYSLNTYQVQKDRFRLDIKYLSDTTGVYMNYLTEGDVKDQLLIRVMNLDRLDSRDEPNPDGFFDFVEGYTVYSQNGKIIFPVAEPFGKHLAKKIGDAKRNGKFIHEFYTFPELYDSTLTIARQLSEKNKFVLKGEFKSSSGSEIRIGAMNVPRGSVRVTAGGSLLTENVDYMVDYSMGTVTITNQSIIDSNVPISVTTENQSTYSMQRKTLLGLDMQYEINKDFNIFGTIMHLSEKPLTVKVNMGNEPISNTIWGLGLSYKTESQWLTNVLDKIPTVTATQPSKFSVQAEVANLIPGHPKELQKQGIAYIDDFEATKTSMDLRTPYAWSLASVPFDPTPNALFPEAALINNLQSNKNRSLINWFRIDGLFTRSMPQTPTHIKNDKDQKSNHYVREVLERELFPNKEATYGQTAVIPVMNIAYYPQERGPYNLDVEMVKDDFTPLYPKKRWGGLMRKMDNTDFEAANYEYIEFWMMAPFPYDHTDQQAGGDLYFNIGELSEDVLHDSKKFFENGMPINGDTTFVEKTVWGKVPTKQSLVYAFDNSPGARKFQDVGLNGLSTEEEFSYPSYSDYLQKLMQKLNPTVLDAMRNDPFSPLNDPAGDNYHYFRGTDYDNENVGILKRYKRFNGVEGNSTSSEDSNESYDISSRVLPDVEDINQDNTLNEYERYFEYKVSISPRDTMIGQNYIVDKRVANVKLANGTDTTITWYQYKIPIRSYDKAVGGIRDFKTIRFMRMFLTNFEKEVHLRFGTLELVRGDWRTYTYPLLDTISRPLSNGTLDVSSVNIEENSGRVPVNYVLPPGVTRMIDPSQPQLRQQNEQALSLTLTDLGPGDARGVYKNTGLDLRQYNNIQMFVHAEAFKENTTYLDNGDMRLFIRMGSDNKSNYYEYEIPLVLTPHGTYNTYNPADQETVWPKSNMLDIQLSTLTTLKAHRNTERRKGTEVSFTRLYSEVDPTNPSNKVSIIGNPSLAEVKSILIGVRNTSAQNKSAVIWVNELRLTNFNEQGGWAAKGNVNLALSDIATINVAGMTETVGFGGIEQKVQQRRMDDLSQYSVATSVELGRLLPEKVKLKAPFYYSMTEQTNTPKYNPLDKDMLMSETLAELSGPQKDSVLHFAQDRISTKSISLSNIKFDVKSKNPMPYDPTNFSVGYSYSENFMKNASTEYELSKNYRGSFTYAYAPSIKPFQPFAGIKSTSKSLKFIKDFGINYLPNSIGFNTIMSRYYFEQQLRDLSSGTIENNIPLSFRKDFAWERSFNLTWNIAKSLRFDINTGTNARIDEPNVAVNKRLFPDEYEIWKDSVWNSILDFGRPMNYTQVSNFSYDLPLNAIPATDWMTVGVKYNASYNWDRGAIIDDMTEIGNIIRNQGAWQFNGRFALESLYNKSKFLRSVNQKFSTSRMTAANPQNRNNNNAGNRNNANQRPVNNRPQKRQFQRAVQLFKDSVITVKHNLDNKKLIVRAKKVRGNDTTTYAVKYKVKGKNEIRILNKDSISILLTVIQGPRPDEHTLYKSAEYASRFVMMLRNVGGSYRVTNSMMVPYFRPEIGGMFGQGSVGGMAPGLDFAFGFTDESYISKALSRGWLISNDSLVSPSTITRMEELQLNATIEPFVGMKIELNANRITNHNDQFQFMFKDAAPIRGGNFTMTTVAIASAFESSSAANGYKSASFDKLLSYRTTISERFQQNYEGTRYPQKGFMNDPKWNNVTYNKDYGVVGLNSPDVLIPAFIAAYTGKSDKSVGLSAFPTLASLLPNWKVNYTGLMAIPFFKRNFKRFDLSHAYRCTYNVGSFSSYQNWVQMEDDFGYIRDVLSGNPTPASPYNITSVTIMESFAPLIGFDGTLQNNITVKAEYRDTRNITMNVSSMQIIEALSKDLTVGSGYKIANFRGFFKNYLSKRETPFSTDLNLRADLTYSLKSALIRKLLTELSEPTSGNSMFMLKLSADWMLSRSLTLRAFFDKQINKPLVSSTAFPISNTNFGLSVKFIFTR